MDDKHNKKKPFEIDKDDSKLDWNEILRNKPNKNEKKDKTTDISIEEKEKKTSDSISKITTEKDEENKKEKTEELLKELNDDNDGYIQLKTTKDILDDADITKIYKEDKTDSNEDETKILDMNNSESSIEDDKEVKKNIKKINKKNKKDKKGKKKHKVLKRVILSLFILFVIAIVAGMACIYAILKTDKWAITEDELLADAGAVVYDLGGNELVRLTGDEINKKINLNEMGKLPDAFISIEDERFYEHKGIDVKRTAYAIFKYITSKLTGKSASFGGSSITQQLIKITMKDNERSGIEGIQRKIREWSRAYQVEKMIDKDQILQRYLNRIYLGSEEGLEIHGVESASTYYFSKSAKDLSIAEAAFIAGINHSPNNYNVFNSKDDITEKVKKRTITVLDKMNELGKISYDEYNEAKNQVNEGLKFEKGKLSNGNSDLNFHTSAAIDQIARELSDKKDISYDEAREQLISSGYSIYTTVNMDVQNKIKEVYEDPKYIINGARYKGREGDISGQSAMCVIEPSTGYVVAEYGGLGTNQNTLGLNRALTKRQGGSSFKPLGVVAPALENKVVTPSTLFYDVRTTFGRNYTVSNDGNIFHNIDTMRNVLKYSCNVPEVKLLSIMGIDKSVDFLGKIGIHVDGDKAGLSMALGTVEVSTVQMAAGYAMIANGGVYITPTFYTKVVDKNGNTIIEPNQEKTRVMTEQNAYVEISLLHGALEAGGTASTYSRTLGNMDVAGKTGTTTDALDRWFCGITPYYATACWYGNDENRARFNGSNPASRVWFNAMKKAHEGLEVKKFNKPEGISTVSICKETGRRATERCTDTYSEIFASDNIPAACEGHEKLKICKETGKVATEFCTDTEEKVFGRVIDTEKNATWTPKLEATEEIPTETCDIHTSAQQKFVPNVVGKTQKEATDLLKAAGYTVKVEKDEDIKKAKGTVLKQSATQAPEGAEIIITVNQVGNASGGNTTGENNTTNETTSNTTTGNTTTNETPEPTVTTEPTATPKNET